MDFRELTKPFQPHQIKERLGKKNMIYKYVPSSEVINRLNSVLGPGGWNLVIKEHIKWDNEVAVLVSLRIGDIVKEAYGSATLDGKSLGDALKTSQALGLVKCCSLFGMPVTFTSNYNQQNTQNYQQNQQKPSKSEDPTIHACMDCGLIISVAEVQFSKKYAHTYKNKILCKECQQNYRSNMRRVK